MPPSDPPVCQRAVGATHGQDDQRRDHEGAPGGLAGSERDGDTRWRATTNGRPRGGGVPVEREVAPRQLAVEARATRGRWVPPVGHRRVAVPGAHPSSRGAVRRRRRVEQETRSWRRRRALVPPTEGREPQGHRQHCVAACDVAPDVRYLDRFFAPDGQPRSGTPPDFDGRPMTDSLQRACGSPSGVHHSGPRPIRAVRPSGEGAPSSRKFHGGLLGLPAAAVSAVRDAFLALKYYTV